MAGFATEAFGDHVYLLDVFGRNLPPRQTGGKPPALGQNGAVH
ncbi:hypothetical protein X760_21695 [Mesorhizobium sp. LSHC422A00]|nr:hypothetical protein X773_28345 [Mesorhizobium sp. LSJC285A00]ESX00712.1 hypothetical protein X768_31050 [Mesorhizobium sp. LSJC265A00]ESX37735.1 hypothetical protein X763_11245 [Mesorhizobium sp. LSHC432A00]ESX48677.1 hypothetical protein X761_27685 [Mesorhizobium sp. LSHC424B00]ESX58084.1 hypothetical protein X760_21695 [Mesorhizobium sp. LSHC422A00]ESY12814.1 hypothetical protein X751_29035 [Mesorhizobium sp. LNJC395A00]ESY33742.1 hypothetical protein X749_01620 [Mesorhizobium sp. LNJC3